jgi:hypothetical protein
MPDESRSTKTDPAPAPVPAAPAEHYHGFWPVFLIGCSLVVILGWEIHVAIVTRASTEQLWEQQLRVVDQAKHLQTELEKIVRDLVELSKTDDTARKIVTKFGVKITNPSTPAATPTP